MSFRSDVTNSVVIDDRNWRDHIKPDEQFDGASYTSASGYIEMPEDEVTCGTTFPDELLIPRDEWKERIEEKERTKSRMSDHCRAAGNIWLNQSPSWYCWCYCVVQAVMAVEIIQGEAPRRLSPESVAGPIMRYRKRGGWPDVAIRYAMEHGIADANAWPWENHNQANNSKYFDGSRENAAQTKVDETVDVLNFDQMMSCVLQPTPIPVPVGLPWMRHAMWAMDGVIMPRGEYGIANMDSYARKGMFNTQTITESKATGRNMMAILSVTPNQLGPTSNTGAMT